jgi:AmiR/NasT family two-component response regulator
VQRFSQYVATAIGNAQTYWRSVEISKNLSVALETRDVIGQAKGILMATSAINADQAFAMLRDASQHLNRKLRDIAVEVTLTGRLPRDPEQHDKAL